ncbi:MAG TPA: hypothetical protein VIG97_09505, partial [Luteimonas sp.]
MFSSAELIEALRRRMRRSLRPPPPPGEFPAGWRDWFAAAAARPGRVAGARPDDVVAVLAAREPAPPPGMVEQLGRWRALSALWRQDWQPASADERGTRVAAMSGSLLLHLLFIAALVWLMVFRLPLAIQDEAAAREGEEHVLQVEYIGEGTPVDAGGGAPEAAPDDALAAEPAPALAPAVETAQDVQPSAPDPADTVADEPQLTPVVVPPPVPVRELAIEVPDITAPPLPAPQDLQLTVVEIPDSRFAVPPPREPEVQAPDSPIRDIAVRSREIDVAEPVDAPAAPPVRAPREVEVAAPAVAAREVTAPERAVELQEVPEIRLRTRSPAPRIDAPEPRPATAAA